MATNRDDDMHSKLPDPIIHHIYSFFEHDEMNAMMIMSKYLRDLCMTSPCLAFGAYLHHPSKSVHNFNRFLHGLLDTQHSSTISKLSLSWHRAKSGRTLHCDKALPKGAYLINLETLALKFFGLELLHPKLLGSCISSNFPSLKTLVLHFDSCSYNGTLALDTPGLLTLQVSGPENSSFKQDFHLKVSCQSLQQLKIQNFNFEDATCKINIITPQLRTLCVDGCNFMNNDHLSSLLLVHAPKLHSFFWKGSAIRDYFYSEESFTLLEEAELEVRRYRDEGCDKFLKKLLHNVQHATRLKMKLSSFRVHGFFASLDTLQRTSRIC